MTNRPLFIRVNVSPCPSLEQIGIYPTVPPDLFDKSPALSHSGGMAKPALGRGLGALLGGSPIAKPPTPGSAPTTIPDANPVTDARERVQRAPLNRIRPSPLQPRKDFSAESL